MKRICDIATILVLVATTSLPANAIDTNVLRRLDEIDTSIRAAKGVISEVTDYFSGQLYTPVNWFNLRQDPIVNDSAVNSLIEDIALISSNIPALREERENILKNAGVASGTCEIHGDMMEYRNVDISYGILLPMPDGYNEARLVAFRNSDESISGGCVLNADSPRTKVILVCPTCARVRQEWLTQHQEEMDNESPNNGVQAIGDKSPQPDP